MARLGLTELDWIALVYFLVMWTGYAPFVQWRGRRVQMLNSAMIDHRRAWMEAQLGRDVKVADTVIVGHIMSTAGFFASTTVIVIAALIGVLFNLGLVTRLGTDSVWPAAGPTPIEIKLILILIVAVYAFQSFTWSIRQANFAAVLMGAAPHHRQTEPCCGVSQSAWETSLRVLRKVTTMACAPTISRWALLLGWSVL